MFTHLCRRAKHHASALVFAAAVGIVLIQPTPAHAIIWFPPPPTCHRTAGWVQYSPGNPGKWAWYEFAYEYKGRRLYGPVPQGTPPGMYLYERVYVYHVQQMMYPYGLVSVGRAEKVCGTMLAR